MDADLGFEIGCPRWQRNVMFAIGCPRWQRNFMFAIAAVGILGIAVFTPLVCLDLVPGQSTWALPVMFAIFAFVGGLGSYIALREKFFLRDGVFLYRKPFKRACSAPAAAVAAVEAKRLSMFTAFYKVTLTDRNGRILFSFFDDGTVVQSRAFLHALIALGIKRSGVLNGAIFD